MALDLVMDNTLNTFYIWLYGTGLGKRPLSERKHCCHYRSYSCLISSKGSFTYTIPKLGNHLPWPLWNTDWNEK